MVMKGQYIILLLLRAFIFCLSKLGIKMEIKSSWWKFIILFHRITKQKSGKYVFSLPFIVFKSPRRTISLVRLVDR